jgi:general nucleoside transport system permease protein
VTSGGLSSGRGWRADALAVASALAVAWIVFDLAVWGYGEAPALVARLLWQGTWGTAYGAGQVLFKATPLLLTGAAVEAGLRAGLFNIGAEGQLTVASLAVGVLGARLVGVPSVVGVPIALAAAFAAGGAWAAIPAWLRARFGAHEVVSTIMMNRIADALVAWLLASGLALRGSLRTADVAPGAKLPRLDALVPAFRGSAVSFALLVALAGAAAAAWAGARTRVGREIALVGANARACEAERIPARRRLAQALVLSGALAGLASAGTVLGYKGYFEVGLGAGAGFGGLAVALLGRSRLVGLVLAALFFGTLQQGGLAINAHVPREVMDVLEGVVILAVALADVRVRARLGMAVGGAKA